MSFAALAACGPSSPEQAAKFCEDRARSALGPTGFAGISQRSDGSTRRQLELSVTSDFLLGRDPYQVYDSCVRQQSGQGPIRPLILDEEY